jgi:hypothetical protein
LTDRFKEFIGLKGVEWTTEMPPLTDAERADVTAKGDRIAGFFAHKNALRPHDVIYLGKKHRFHTIAHEGFHGKLAGMSEAELAPWARAVGIENTKEGWNEERFTGRDGNKTSAHEYIAEAWEDYLTDRNSQSVPDSLRGLFDRMAAAMRRVFEALGRAMREVPPELKTLMDNLAAGEAARMEAEARDTTGGKTGAREYISENEARRGDSSGRRGGSCHT